MTDRDCKRLILQRRSIDEKVMSGLAHRLASIMGESAVVFLEGQLGAGKTTFVRAYLRACGHTGSVKSPTYTLVESYELNDKCFYHFDLYRLQHDEELEWIGIRDYMGDDNIWMVEWPSKASQSLPKPDLIIDFEVEGTARHLNFIAKTEKAAAWLRLLEGDCV